MIRERRNFPQGEFLRQFNSTGRIDRKNAARTFNEARDPYFQKGLREQGMQDLARILEEARSQPKPTSLTAHDTIPILERAKQQGERYLAEQFAQGIGSRTESQDGEANKQVITQESAPTEISTVEADRKKAATELRDLLNKKADRMREMTGDLMGIYMKFPGVNPENVSQVVWQLVDRQLNKMSDEGHTKEAVNLVDDKEGMLRLRIEIAKQFLERETAARKQAEQEKQAAEGSKAKDNGTAPKPGEDLPRVDGAATEDGHDKEKEVKPEPAESAPKVEADREKEKEKKEADPLKPEEGKGTPKKHAPPPAKAPNPVAKDVAPTATKKRGFKDRVKSFIGKAKDKIASFFRVEKREEGKEKIDKKTKSEDKQPSGEKELIKAMSENLKREDYELMGSSLHEHIPTCKGHTHVDLDHDKYPEKKHNRGRDVRLFLAGAVVGSLTTLLGVGIAQYYFGRFVIPWVNKVPELVGNRIDWQ